MHYETTVGGRGLHLQNTRSTSNRVYLFYSHVTQIFQFRPKCSKTTSTNPSKINGNSQFKIPKMPEIHPENACNPSKINSLIELSQKIQII